MSAAQNCIKAERAGIQGVTVGPPHAFSAIDSWEGKLTRVSTFLQGKEPSPYLEGCYTEYMISTAICNTFLTQSFLVTLKENQMLYSHDLKYKASQAKSIFFSAVGSQVCDCYQVLTLFMSKELIYSAESGYEIFV